MNLVRLPSYIQFGPLQIHFYALCILTGALIAYILGVRRFKQLGYGEPLISEFSDYFIYLLLIGILGARLWYVVFEWRQYAAHPEEILMIWHGGLAIHGGIVAAVIYSYLFFKKHGVPFLVAGDAIMPGVLIAQACGRWGNFFNQEAYGSEVSLSFLKSLHLPSWLINNMFIQGAYHHPTFLYESLANVCLFLIIVLIIRRFAKHHGVQFFSYFIGYGLVRFPIEAMRTDSLMIGPLKMAQVTSIAFILIGIIGMLYVHFKGDLIQ